MRLRLRFSALYSFLDFTLLVGERVRGTGDAGRQLWTYNRRELQVGLGIVTVGEAVLALRELAEEIEEDEWEENEVALVTEDDEEW